jgi:glycogen(starch) synthase
MRILYWSDVFWPEIGGTELLGARLVDALRERGYRCLVVASNAGLNLPEKDDYRGTPVRRFPFWNGLAAGTLEGLLEIRQAVAQLRREFRPDLVHVAFIAPGVFFQLETARAHPAPLLVTMQQQMSTFAKPGPARLLATALGAADWVVSCSGTMRSEVERVMPEVACRSSVIANALEAPTTEPVGLPRDPARLLCLGRLAPEKGFDLLLRAFATIADSFPGVEVTLAGDGPMRSELENLADRLGVRQRVEFRGWVSPAEVPALLNEATAVVMPSREEAYPLVAIETALMARPLVAARVGGLRDAVVDRQTGLLFPPEDVNALASALTQILGDEQMAQRLGRRAREWGLEKYSWDGFVTAYENLYQQIYRRWQACSERTAGSL